MAVKLLKSRMAVYTPDGSRFVIESDRIQTREQYRAMVRAKGIEFFEKSEIKVAPRNVPELSFNFAMLPLTEFYPETPEPYAK